MVTPADLLAEIGQALFGAEFRTQLAAAINVNERTVRRWLAGDGTPGPGVWADLEALCMLRRKALHELALASDKARVATGQ